MAEQTKEDESKKLLKHRSPAWPFISLRKALERATVFYKPQREHPAPIAAAVGLWDFAVKSSGGLQTVSALKQYGLLDDVENQSGQIKLTDLALRIIRDQREPSPERVSAIKQAALHPKIFAELWQNWGATLPADATVRFFLVQTKKYNDAAVSALIVNYKDTIEYAKLSESDKTGSAEGESETPEGKIPPAPPVPKGAKLMEGERIVFTHEIEPDHGVRVLASGEVDESLLDALELYIQLQNKRLGRKPEKKK